MAGVAIAIEQAYDDTRLAAGFDIWRFRMNSTVLTLALVLASICAGCSTTQRSRALGNGDVPAETIALQVCSNCHGVDGNATSPNFPNLAGQQQVYFIAQLNGFKSHDRSDPAGFEYMWGLSKHLTEDQIKGLAAYYAQQRPAPNALRNAEPMSEGKEIFDKGIASKNIPPCATCHGAEGQGNEQFPRLANQHADYLIKQLRVFQRTDQRPEASAMKVIAHSLTAENIRAVANYLEAIPGKN
jgi:cytochrome c553